MSQIHLMRWLKGLLHRCKYVEVGRVGNYIAVRCKCGNEMVSCHFDPPLVIPAHSMAQVRITPTEVKIIKVESLKKEG